MDYILDHSDFKKQIRKMIPKAENTSKHKCNQTGRWQEIILPEYYYKDPVW